MNSIAVYLVAGILLWVIGLYGLLVNRHVVRRVIALNLMSSGVFMVMVTLAMRASPPDPVLHALVLTGLIVAVCSTAFALRLGSAHRVHGPGKNKDATE